MKKTDVNILDPEFVGTLQEKTRQYQEALSYADYDKWGVAVLVNGMYPEHKSIFAGDKMAYYIECSRVANEGMRVPVFGSSGQTLRRWCEVAAAYENFPQAELLLEETSFKHLSVAKRAAKQEKAASPIAAMDWALAMGASADDMQEHYFPAEIPDPYKQFSGVMSSMLDPFTYSWISDAEVISKLICKAREYEDIKNDYLKKKGLHE